MQRPIWRPRRSPRRCSLCRITVHLRPRRNGNVSSRKTSQLPSRVPHLRWVCVCSLAYKHFTFLSPIIICVFSTFSLIVSPLCKVSNPTYVHTWCYWKLYKIVPPLCKISNSAQVYDVTTNITIQYFHHAKFQILFMYMVLLQTLLDYTSTMHSFQIYRGVRTSNSNTLLRVWQMFYYFSFLFS